MRLHRCLRACGWIAIFALVGAANRAVSVPPSAPPSAWKIVDAFQMKVKVYPRAAGSDRASPTTKDAKPIASFDVHAVLLPVLPFEECGCWKLQFVAFSKSPEFKNPYRLWIDKGNSYTRKANRFVGPQELTLAPTEVVPMVLEAPPGFPVEFIPELENATLPTERKDTTLEISSRTVDNVIERKAIVRMNGKPEIEIRQRWLPGAKWWSEYERFYRGQLDLQASLIVPKAAMPLPTPPRPPTPLGPDDFRSDPRLKIRITTALHNRPLQDLLDLLSQKSGVELKMDAALAAVEPGFGGSTLIGVPAWQVMERLAHDFLVEGRWDKTGAGYQLSATRAVEARRPLPPPPKMGGIALRVGLSYLSLVAFGVFLVWLHLRRKPQPLPQSPSAPSATDRE